MDLNMIKQATPFVPLADNNGLNTKGRKILGLNHMLKKQPSKFNINIANRSLADNFNLNDLIKPLTQQSLSLPQHYTLGQYIQKFPPTPAGVSYRRINPVALLSETVSDAIYDYTTLLNMSGLYPEKLSYPDFSLRFALNTDEGPRDKSELYQTDSRETANWLWNRRGLLLTDELWDRAVKARLSAHSQLNKMPLSLYFAWSHDKDNNTASSLRLSNDEGFNLFMHVFNPKFFDRPYLYRNYSGYSLKLKDGLPLEQWERLMNFLDAQDHELSHSFNNTWNPTRYANSFYNSHFWKVSNDPKKPIYDNDTVDQRLTKYDNIFGNTYLVRPPEYMGAMARVKRYGAELGFDTTSPDPAKARSAMALTLHHFATHKNPQELTPEQQRIHSWLNTAAGDHMIKYYQDDEDDYVNKLLQENPVKSEEEFRQILQFKTDKDNHIKDVKSPFYKDVLDFMTDDTIQGLVQTNPNLNNTQLT